MPAGVWYGAALSLERGMGMKKRLRQIAAVFSAAVLCLSGLPATPASGAQEDAKLIALTFDDGPNTTTTNEVLDVLEAYNAKASFFLIGDKIDAESAEVVKRAYDMGMEIDNHSRTHSNMSELTAEEIRAEIAFVDEKVTEITGEPTRFFRPPYIDVNQTMYDVIGQPFICGIDCRDYLADVDAQARAEYIVNGAKDGVIVLLHDFTGNTQTVEALKIAMPQLAAQGYEFVTLTELFDRQGESPRYGMLYSNVAKYPCRDYMLYQTLTTETAERIPLDAALLDSLGEDYAIEVDYSSEVYPPVAALQKWTGDPPIWKAVQPVYANGDKAVFLASDVLAALGELGISYADLDGVTLSAYSGDIAMSNAKLLVKSQSAGRVTGDVDRDGEVGVLDLVMLQKWLLGAGTLTDPEAADLDQDGCADVFDLGMLKRRLMQKQ